MRLMNLEVEDLFLLSTNKSVTSTRNKTADVLELELGEPLNATLSNKVYFGGSEGWDVTNDSALEKGSYSLKMGFDAPLIRDEGTSLNNSHSLVFTGVYAKDGSHLLANAHLNYTNRNQLKEVRIVAGGLKPDETGKLIYNLAVLVPWSMSYTVEGIEYSCRNGKPIEHSNSEKLPLAHIVSDLVVYA